MNAGRRDRIAALAEAFERAWNDHDAHAIGTLHTADADLIDAGGITLHGREAITAFMQYSFRTTMSSSKLALTIGGVRSIGRGGALVHGVYSVRGEVPRAVAHLPVQTGILLFVAIEERNTWRIAFTQRSSLDPAQTMLQ